MTGKTPLPYESQVPSEAPPLYEASTSSNTLDSSSSTSSSTPTSIGRQDSDDTQSWRKTLQTLFLTSASQGEVRRIVLSLIGDNVKEYHTSGFDAKIAKSILQNCAQACNRQGMPFSSPLQSWYHAVAKKRMWCLQSRVPESNQVRMAYPSRERDMLVSRYSEEVRRPISTRGR
uniref:Uncharacterized protein n=1 Tax=Moniliophthora roreri TaxID=221103 RepID=A0A0W0EYE0_MONRR